MPSPLSQSNPRGALAVPRATCYACLRAQVACICAETPRVRNKSTIFVVQHPREVLHPLGTTRLLRLGLERVDVQVYSKQAAPRSLPAGTALLFPSAKAVELGTMKQLPSNLLVIDGTWPHAKSIYRTSPWMHALPHVAITPTVPSQYRIRREPRAHCLSTLEAVVQALEVLEPDTENLEALRQAFIRMIDRRIELRAEHPAQPYKRRVPRQKSGSVPRPLRDRQDDIVLVYAEFVFRDHVRHLATINAQRLTSAAHFSRVIKPRALPDATHCEKMGIRRSDVEAAAGIEDVAPELEAFLKPHDILMAWNQTTLDLLAPHVQRETLLLKAAYCNLRQRQSGPLEEMLAREGLAPVPVPFSGRAAVRMGASLAVARWLGTIAPAASA